MESGIFFSDYRSDMSLRRMPLQKVRTGLLLVGLLVFPFLASPYWLHLANQIAIATIGAIGLNILVGYTGQISLGQGAFMAIGAYGAGLLTVRLGVPFYISIPAAALITAVAGLVVGLPSLRLKGLYLAVATLAAQQIVEFVVTHWDGLTGGTEALVVPAPELFGARLNTDGRFYWILVVIALAVALFAANLFRSRVGRAWLSGALLAHYRSIVTWERFTIEVSISYLAMIIIGGLGTISGSFFGATLIVLLPAVINTVGRSLQDTAPWAATVLPYVQQGVFGLVIILFLVLEPEGLAKLWRNVKDYFRVWPFSY